MIKSARRDPTRSGILFRGLAAKLRAQFRSIEREMRALIVGEDAFGLTQNVFCPTGKGGGVDPSCGNDPPGFEILLDDKKEYVVRFQAGSKGFFFQAGKSGEGWDIGFGEEEKLGKGVHTASMTNDPSIHPLKVLRGVERSLNKFIESKSPGRIAFTAFKGDESRVKFYDRIAREIGKHHGYDVEHVDYPAWKEYVLKKKTVANSRFSFQSDPDKLKSFERWIRGQLENKVKGLRQKALWDTYLQTGFTKGMQRSYDDVARLRGFKSGEAKSQFMQMDQERADRVKLLAQRTYTDLVDVTERLGTRMGRVLADGMMRGQTPKQIAETMSVQLHIEQNRALTIARTECLTADTLISTAVVRAIFRRRYVGPIVEIVTSRGRKFSATPNHPMLTAKGWIGAGLLKNGDNLIGCCGKDQLGSSGDVDVERRPSSIGEIFDSLNAKFSVKREAARDGDFHGDGFEGEVEVLRPDRELKIGSFSPLHEKIIEPLLSSSHHTKGSSLRFCGSCGCLLPVDKTRCLVCGSESNSSRTENSLKAISVALQVPGDGTERLFRNISAHDRVVVDIGSELIGYPSILPSELLSLGLGTAYSSISNDATDLPLRDIEHPRDFILVEPGNVELDNVVSVRFSHFDSYVYNLETKFGYYAMDQLYSANCTRAHAEGQLLSFKRLGIQELGVLVEWTSANKAICKRCESMLGRKFTLEKAAGLIPLHPNCMCSFVPALAKPPGKGRLSAKSIVKRKLMGVK